MQINKNTLDQFKRNGFLSESGYLNSDTLWQEKKERNKKRYLFDSGNAQDFALYVSDIMIEWVKSVAILDINDMLTYPESMRCYLKVGALIFIRSKFDIACNRNNEDFENDDYSARFETAEVCIQFTFNAWTSMNNTARGIHLRDKAERSILGQVSSLNLNDGKLYVRLTPLGISPNFVLHDPSHGAWVSGQNNSHVNKRVKMSESVHN